MTPIAVRFPSRLADSLLSRPKLLGALGVGTGVGLVLGFTPTPFDGPTSAILAWDAGCLFFVTATLWSFADRDAPYMRGVAARQDEGQGIILGLVIALSAASLGAVGLELSLAKHADGLDKALRVTLAFGTLAASWFVAQLIFALHYAHEFYSPDDGDPDTQQKGGLKFPDDASPDYWDFVHFAIVIGVATQTADISFVSRRMRRLGTVHSLVAFAFNTLIVALAINVLAGLF